VARGVCRTLLALVAALGLLAGSAATAQELTAAGGGDSAPPAPVKLRFATLGVGVTSIFADLAIEQGIFRRHGVDLEIVHFVQGGAEAMAGVASGGIDMGSFGTPILIGLAAGVPIKLVGSPAQKRQMFELVARTGIASVKDLKGRVVASGALGGGSHESLLKVLKANGLTPAEVRIVASGGADANLVLRSGKIDAVVTSGLNRWKLVDEGVGTLVARARDYYGRYQHSFVLATNKFIAEHPETIRNYFRAERESLEYARSHLDELVARTGKLIKLRPELIADYYRELFADWDLSFAVDVEGTANAVAILQELKEIKATVRFDPATWLDLRFLD